MDHVLYISAGQVAAGNVEHRSLVAPVKSKGRLIMDSLKPQLYPHEVFPVDFRKQIKDISRKTIRSRPYHETAYLGIFEDRPVFSPEYLYRRISVGVILKIGQIPGLRPFFRQQLYLLIYG